MSARGFTLVELLVAITLLGLISVALSGTISFGTRVWETVEDRGAEAARVMIVHDLLRRQIGQAVIPAALESAPEPPEVFVGEATALRFVALLPAHMGVGGFYVFDVRTIDGEDSTDLELAWQLYRDTDRLEALAADEGQRRVLISGIDTIAFEYFGAEGPLDDPRWLDRWDDPTRLPLAVAVRLRFPDGDSRTWPDAIAAPFAAQSIAQQ